MKIEKRCSNTQTHKKDTNHAINSDFFFFFSGNIAAILETSQRFCRSVPLAALLDQEQENQLLFFCYNEIKFHIIIKRKGDTKKKQRI